MTRQKETGGSAFPTEHFEYTPPTIDYDGHWKPHPGMSLRDWFAGMALQGLCANPRAWEEMTEDELVMVANRRAEKMLEARKS